MIQEAPTKETVGKEGIPFDLEIKELIVKPVNKEKTCQKSASLLLYLGYFYR